MRYDEYFRGDVGRSTGSNRGGLSDHRPGVDASQPLVHPDGEDDGQVHPWARFYARSIDYMLFYVLLDLAWPEWRFHLLTTSVLLFSIVVLFAWTLPEALLLSVLGTTPGKWVLGLRVERKDGGALRIGEAWMRAVSVWLRGQGAGIPIVSLFTLGKAYSVLNSEGESSWDRDLGTAVRAKRRSGAMRFAAGGAAIVVLSLASTWNLLESAGRGTGSAAEQALAGQRTQMEDYVAKQGGWLDPLSEVLSGSLYAGETEEIAIPVGSRGTLWLVGACDDDCFDLDVALVSPAGDTLYTDENPDAWPVAFAHASSPGDYTAVVSMYECSIEPCGYAVQAFRPEGVEGSTSTGTCFAVSPDGLLVTAQHVVDGVTEVTVTYTDGRQTRADVVREDTEHDVAVLYAADAPPGYLGFAPTGSSRPGDYVFTLGFPATDLLGAEPKFTDGSISSLSGIRGDRSLLQISVPIQPGNSGGPLLHSNGNVVGLISATATSRAFEQATGVLPQNVNWAVKSEYAADLIDRPTTRTLTRSHREAVDRAYDAVCLVEVTYD